VCVLRVILNYYTLKLLTICRFASFLVETQAIELYIIDIVYAKSIALIAHLLFYQKTKETTQAKTFE